MPMMCSFLYLLMYMCHDITHQVTSLGTGILTLNFFLSMSLKHIWWFSYFWVVCYVKRAKVKCPPKSVPNQCSTLKKYKRGKAMCLIALRSLRQLLKVHFRLRGTQGLHIGPRSFIFFLLLQQKRLSHLIMQHNQISSNLSLSRLECKQQFVFINSTEC